MDVPILSLLTVLAALSPEVELFESFECPDIGACDCMRGYAWSSQSSDYVECNGDIDGSMANFSSISKYKIKTFKFKDVSFQNLNPNMFEDLDVDTLSIENSEAMLQRSVFLPLKSSLKHLDLIHMNIFKTWNISFLENFTDLESFNLERNGVYPVHFPDNVFRDLNLSSLQNLSLRHCDIAKITDMAFEGLENLVSLDLSYNELPVIPHALLLLHNLQQLNLSHNDRLVYVHDGAFLTMKNLRSIELSYTGLQTISLKAFIGLEDCLETLKLDHCKLQNGHFSTMKELKKFKTLDLSYNEISDMHNKSFEGFTSLEELDISGQLDISSGYRTSVGFIDSVFRGIEDKLRVLKIRDLDLESLPLGSISSLKQLKILDASGNDFTEIDDGFFYEVHARTIYLQDMAISNIFAEAFSSLPQGVNIYFDRNNITNISFILETKLCLFQTLSLKDNPISCDCGVIKIAATNRVKELIGTCADPLYRHENLRHVHEIDHAKVTCGVHEFKKINYCYIESSGSYNIFQRYLHILFYSLSFLYACVFVFSL